MTTPERASVDDGALERRNATAGDWATDNAQVTLSAEQVRAGTQWVATSRLRLRRRVVTETRMVEVTLRREELVVDELEIPPDATSALSAEPSANPDGDTAAPLVIVLRREIPALGVRVVPYEQVNVITEYVTTEQAIQSQVRHEEVDFRVEPTNAVQP